MDIYCTFAGTMKRLLTILLVLWTALSSHAVLKEKDLDQTLQILRTELSSYNRELKERMERAKQYNEQLRDQLIATLKQSNRLLRRMAIAS